MKLKISSKNHYESSYHMIYSFLGMSFVLGYLVYSYGYHTEFFIAFILWYAFYEGTGIYLHFEYWYKNRGEEFIFTEDKIIRLKNGRKEE